MGLAASAQSANFNIPVGQTPQEVQRAVTAYLRYLNAAESLEQAAEFIAPMAGGGLVNEDGSLRKDVPQFSLKKDWQNAKFYAFPPQITRVAKLENKSSGYGATAIRGTQYKVWIAKKEGASGVPAPVSFIVPAGETQPKLVNIGSF